MWHPFVAMGAVRTAEFVVARAKDMWVWDIERQRYLDATASPWYANVGHGREEIIEAIAAQLREPGRLLDLRGLCKRASGELA